MRYEGESRVWSKAAGIVRERVRGLPEYSRLRAELVRGAVAACRGRDVAGMRELGGFSAVLERLIAALPSSVDAPHGSQLLPWTLRDELRAAVPTMRGLVQAAIVTGGEE